VEDLARVDTFADELLARRLDVGDDEEEILSRARGTVNLLALRRPRRLTCAVIT
jgi:hypothetical protein